MENNVEERKWADMTATAEKSTVEEATEKSLKDRDSEERDSQKKRKDIIIFGLPDLKKNEPEDRKEEDVKKLCDLQKHMQDQYQPGPN